jgi:transcriptional regulator with XRE-family HTH domain
MTDGQSIVAGLRCALGAELAAQRTERKLTQAQLAECLHVHRTTAEIDVFLGAQMPTADRSAAIGSETW